MHGLDQFSQYIPVIGLSMLSGLFILQITIWLALKKANAHQTTEIEKLKTNVSVLTSGALGMGHKMLNLETKYQRLRDLQEEYKQNDLDFSYTQAQQLISQGVDDKAVAANSGLSSSEINLMRLLQTTQQHESVHHA